MKNKNGFTLVEVLGTIIIVVIISLIVIPIVASIVDDVRKEAFRSTAYGLIASTDNYVSTNNFRLPITFTYPEEESQYKLSYKGTQPKKGFIVINNENRVKVRIENEFWCALKNYEEAEVKLKKGNCDVEINPNPRIEIRVDGKEIDESLIVPWEVNDPFNIDRIEVKAYNYDDKEITVSGPTEEDINKIDVSVLGAEYQLTYTAKDNETNLSVTKVITIKMVDTIKPEIQYQLNPTNPTGANNWYINDIEVGVNLTDSGSGAYNYEYKISLDNGNTYNEYKEMELNDKFIINNNSDKIKFKIKGKDIAGNYSEEVISDTIKIDKTIPEISNKGTIEPIVAGSSNVVIDYFNISNYGVSGGNTVCKTNNITLTNTSTLEAGNQTITCSMTTGAGVSTSVSIDVIIFVPEKTFNYLATEQTYVIPTSGTYEIRAYGARGGGSGGYGGHVSGLVYLEKGTVLKVRTGGTNGTNGGGTGSIRGGGSTTIVSGSTTLLIAAGGGGGKNGTVGGTGSGTGGAKGNSSVTGGNGTNGGGGGAGGTYSICTEYHPTTKKCSTCKECIDSYTYTCNCSTCGGGRYCKTPCVPMGGPGSIPCSEKPCWEWAYYPTYTCHPCDTCSACRQWESYSCNCKTTGGGCKTTADTYNSGNGGTNVIHSSLTSQVKQNGINSTNGYAKLKYIIG